MKTIVIGHDDSAGERIKKLLRHRDHIIFNLAVAYARRGGVDKLRPAMKAFAKRGGKIHAIVGVNQGNTSYQAVNLLSELDNVEVSLRINPNRYSSTFHPKLYLFGKQSSGKEVFSSALIGSANLTRGGLSSNVECSVLLEKLDGKNQAIVKAHWNSFLFEKEGFITLPGNDRLYKKMLKEGKLIDENSKDEAKKRDAAAVEEDVVLSTIVSEELLPRDKFFAMTLGHFDVSKKSADPVIKIPLAALRENENFWFYPTFFSVERILNGFRFDAEVEVDGKVHEESVRLYENPNRGEFRLKSALIKRKGDIGDIMLVKRTSDGMRIKLVRKNDALFKALDKKAKQAVSNSEKKFGYFSRMP